MKSVIGLIGAAVLAIGCSGQDGEFYSEQQELGQVEQAVSLTGTAYDAMGNYAPNPDVLAPRMYADSCLLLDARFSPAREIMVVAGGYATFTASGGGFSTDDPQTISANASASNLTFRLDKTQAANAQWTTAGNLNVARAGAKFIKLSNTQCLAVGGVNAAGNPVNSSEIFDITTGTAGTWTLSNDTMTVPRVGHQVKQCAGGKVLAIGGASGTTPLVATKSIDVYDPSNDTWNQLAVMNEARIYPAAAVQDSNFQRFIIAQGDTLAGLSNKVEFLEVDEDCDLIDADEGSETVDLCFDNNRNLGSSRVLSEAAPIAADDFLVLGGSTAALTGTHTSLATTLRITVDADAWATQECNGEYAVANGPAMSVARREFLFKELGAGRFALVGGRANSAIGESLNTIEVFNAGAVVFENLQGDDNQTDTILANADGRFQPVAELFSTATNGDVFFVSTGAERTTAQATANTPGGVVLSSTVGL
jgi:hypothetical protein